MNIQNTHSNIHIAMNMNMNIFYFIIEYTIHTIKYVHSTVILQNNGSDLNPEIKSFCLYNEVLWNKSRGKLYAEN